MALTVGAVGSRIPRLSYHLVRIPMNELRDQEWLDVVDEVSRK